MPPLRRPVNPPLVGMFVYIHRDAGACAKDLSTLWNKTNKCLLVVILITNSCSCRGGTNTQRRGSRRAATFDRSPYGRHRGFRPVEPRLFRVFPQTRGRIPISR